MALAFSIAAMAWGAGKDPARTERRSVPTHTESTAARRRVRTRRTVRRRHTTRARAASRTHLRRSSDAVRRAEARRRAALRRHRLAERARLRYAEHRRLERRAYLARAAADRAQSLPGAVLNEQAASLRPFSQPVALHISWRHMPLPLRGSLALLQRQDDRLKADNLKPIETEAQLSESIANKKLVPIPVSDGLTVNAHLEPNHRYCRPWTARFLADLARAHEDLFHRSLEVTSAVRPATYQARLERINGNAAPAKGDIFSPHLMGATIDIGKHGLSRREIAWMRVNLLALEQAGKIDVEEEFHQACFHITVYPSYVAPPSAAPVTATRDTMAPANAAPLAGPAGDFDPLALTQDASFSGN